MTDAAEALELLDWRRRVFELYARVRAASDPAVAWREWRGVRDDLFAHHPQSPLAPEARVAFEGLPVFDYDPELRVLARIEPAEPQRRELATSGREPYGFTRFGRALLELGAVAATLDLYWLDGYGGGLFLPFADGTSGRETYGAGRYLLDTVKGSDLGSQCGRLVLDFNFAYNPSCAYNPRWVCPLAPAENCLAVEVRAGEQSAQSA